MGYVLNNAPSSRRNKELFHSNHTFYSNIDVESSTQFQTERNRYYLTAWVTANTAQCCYTYDSWTILLGKTMLVSVPKPNSLPSRPFESKARVRSSLHLLPLRWSLVFIGADIPIPHPDPCGLPPRSFHNGLRDEQSEDWDNTQELYKREK